MTTKQALKLVKDELKLAQSQHGPMNSPREGYAVILEEVDELWEEIKAGQGDTHRGVSEAVQTAAAALRYLVDLCDAPAAAEHKRKVQRYVSMPDSYFGGGSYSG